MPIVPSCKESEFGVNGEARPLATRVGRKRATKGLVEAFPFPIRAAILRRALTASNSDATKLSEQPVAFWDSHCM